MWGKTGLNVECRIMKFRKNDFKKSGLAIGLLGGIAAGAISIHNYLAPNNTINSANDATPEQIETTIDIEGIQNEIQLRSRRATPKSSREIHTLSIYPFGREDGSRFDSSITNDREIYIEPLSGPLKNIINDTNACLLLDADPNTQWDTAVPCPPEHYFQLTQD
jgi:hypothetical protein